jgi:hypothetical protein
MSKITLTPTLSPRGRGLFVWFESGSRHFLGNRWQVTDINRERLKMGWG